MTRKVKNKINALFFAGKDRAGCYKGTEEYDNRILEKWIAAPDSSKIKQRFCHLTEPISFFIS